MDHYQNIAKYLSGAMSDDERQAFEAAMAEDATLRTTVELYPALMASVEQQARMEARAAIKHSASQASNSVAPVRRMNIRFISRIAAVGLVAVLAGAVIVANTLFSSNRLIQQAYLFPEDLSINQSGPGEQPVTGPLIQTWNQGDQQQAITDAENELTRQPENDALQYLLAHFYFSEGDYAAARRLFEELSEYAQYRDESEFVVALCDLHLGQDEQGENALRDIASDERHGMSEEARQLLRNLGSPLRVFSFN